MRATRWALVALLILSLAGCGTGREPEHTTLIRILGVDGEGESVVLTAAAEPEGEEVSSLLSGAGGTMTAARAALTAVGEDYPATTHMTQMVVGSAQELYPLLLDCVKTRETGYSATLWLTDGTAAALLAACGGGVRRLESIEENGGAATTTILDALVTLERTGRVTLPVLGAEAGTLVLKGYRTEVREE